MSGRATFGLDQSPDQLLNVDSDSTSVHQVRYIKPRRRPSIGYIDNRNHRLINISNKYIGRFKRFTLLTFYQLRYGTHPILPVAGCAWQRDRLVARPSPMARTDYDRGLALLGELTLGSCTCA
jgi:hypothetical protein